MAAANRYGADLPRTKDSSLSGPHFGDFPILSLGLSDYPVVYLGARFGFPGQKIADDHDHLTFFLIFIGGDGFLFMGLRANYFFMRSLLRQIGRKKNLFFLFRASLPICVELPRGEGIKGIDLSDRLTHAAEQPSRRTSRVVRLFIISLGEKKCEYNRSFSYFFRAFFLFFLGLILRARAATTKVAFFPSFLLFSSSLFSPFFLSFSPLFFSPHSPFIPRYK